MVILESLSIRNLCKIDCEGGFDLSIYHRIIDTLLKSHSKIKTGSNTISEEAIKAKFFERLHYKRILDHLELIEFLQKLPNLLKERKNIKLVIFDSFTSHFKSMSDQKNITKIINEYSMLLLQLSSTFNVSVRIICFHIN